MQKESSQESAITAGNDEAKSNSIKKLLSLLKNFYVSKTTLYKDFIRNQRRGRKRKSHYGTSTDITGSIRKIRRQKGTGHARVGRKTKMDDKTFGYSGNKLKDEGRRNRDNYKVNKKEALLSRLGVIANKFRNNLIIIFNNNQLLNEKEYLKSLIMSDYKNENKKSSYLIIYCNKNKHIKNILTNRFFIDRMCSEDISLLKLLKNNKLVFEEEALYEVLNRFSKILQKN